MWDFGVPIVYLINHTELQLLTCKFEYSLNYLTLFVAFTYFLYHVIIVMFGCNNNIHLCELSFLFKYLTVRLRVQIITVTTHVLYFFLLKNIFCIVQRIKIKVYDPNNMRAHNIL